VTYHVEFTARAERDLEHLYDQINAAESIAAARWFNKLEEAVYTLERIPRRCPSAPESTRTRRPLRNLLYGRKPHVCRIIYEIDEHARKVQILTIRHGAMEAAAPEQL
jgi:plasmid stabilization system protein ParE